MFRLICVFFYQIVTLCFVDFSPPAGVIASTSHEPFETNSLDADLEAERRINSQAQLEFGNNDLESIIQTSVSSKSSNSSLNWKKELKKYGVVVGRMRFDAGVSALNQIKTTELMSLRDCIVDSLMSLSACTYDFQISLIEFLPTYFFVQRPTSE